MVWLQPLLKARRFLDEKELDLLETLCLEVGVVFPRVFKGSVAPKIHKLVFHLPRIARHLGTVEASERTISSPSMLLGQYSSAPCLCQSRGGEAQADVATG